MASAQYYVMAQRGLFFDTGHPDKFHFLYLSRMVLNIGNSKKAYDKMVAEKAFQDVYKNMVTDKGYCVSRNNRTGINKRVFFQKSCILHREYGK